jgi:hypothetical protein
MLLMQINTGLMVNHIRKGYMQGNWPKLVWTYRLRQLSFQEHKEHCLKNLEKFLAKPDIFLFLKHALFISRIQNNIHKHVWTKKLTKKKHQSIKIKHEVPNQKNFQLKATYMFMQHGFKIDFLNSLDA